MGVQIVSTNLNQFGNAGQFEADRSTWLISTGMTGPGIGLQRSLDQAHAGTYSARVINSVTLFGNTNRASCCPAQFTALHNKKYLLRAWIYVPSATPLAPDTWDVFINGLTVVDTQWTRTKISETKKTILDCKGSWQQIETKVTFTFTNPSAWPSGADQRFYIILVPPGSTVLDTTGTLDSNAIPPYPGSPGTHSFHIDEFEVYEYIDVEDEPTCTLVLDEESTEVVDETTPASNDGSITVATVGGEGTLEYSINSTTVWQSSNQFTGLTSGVYIIRVREVDSPTCIDQASFAINSGPIGFDFEGTVLHESVLGANDGQIEITVGGTGGPFTFTKSDPSGYQGSNIFSNLAAGFYFITVKNAAGDKISHAFEVQAGVLLFEKAYFSKNPVPFQVNALQNYDALNNYRIYCDTRVEDESGSGIFISKMKQELEPDTAGKVVFNLRPAFRNVVNAIPPDYNANGIEILTDRAKLFKNYYGHLQDDDVTPDELIPTSPFLVILGGIDKFNFPTLNYLTTYLQTNKKFLTWAPLVKDVDRLQEDYLTFLVYTTQITLLQLMAKVYFDDGTDETYGLVGANGLKHGQLLQFPAGPLNTGVAGLNPEKNAIKYDLWLINQVNAVVSEVRTYNIARDRNPRTRFFMILNSLGQYEVHRFTGSTSTEEKIDRTVIQKHLPMEYNPYDGELESNDVSGQRIYSFSTGYFSGRYADQWLEYMRELVRSRRFYDVTTGKRIPLMITTNNVKLKEDHNYERFVRIEAVESYMNENFTPDVT